MRVLTSWSGGKDSCYALMQAKEQGQVPVGLFNIMNKNGIISRSHGLPLSVIKQQADAIGVPLCTKPSSWDKYETNYIKTLVQLKNDLSFDGVVFGDIDLEDHRKWEEMVCANAELLPILPLWQRDRKQLVFEMINKGIQAIIVSCNTQLGNPFLGREITSDLIDELEAMGIDVCGENGEYHTVVINCPLFNNPIKLPKYTKVQHENYCFIKWDR